MSTENFSNSYGFFYNLKTIERWHNHSKVKGILHWQKNTVDSKHLQQKTQLSWHLSRSMSPLSVSNASLFPSKWWMLCCQSVSCGACIWLNWRIICVQHFFLCWWRLWYQFPFWKHLRPVSLKINSLLPCNHWSVKYIRKLLHTFEADQQQLSISHKVVASVIAFQAIHSHLQSWKLPPTWTTKLARM